MKHCFVAAFGSLALVILIASPIRSISANRPTDSNVAKSSSSLDTYSTITESVVDPIVPWPILFGVQRTGMVDACFDCYGRFGSGYTSWSFNVPGWPAASFDTPPGLGHCYLYTGAIWIGGILDGDTSVTTGADGYLALGEEFSPDDPRGTVRKFEYPTDYSMRAHFTDTAFYTDPSIFPYPDHRALNLDIVCRSHVFRTERYEDIIIYDVIVTNIGTAVIESTWVGFYWDVDAGLVNEQYIDYFSDDIAGSLREHGIGYVIDDDGEPDPTTYTWNDTTSIRKIFAFRLLASSHDIPDTNFNWWVQQNNIYTPIDFSPRLRGTPEDPFFDFETGGTGIPYGDIQKYYVLSHREWDYDQIFTSSIASDDPVWCYPPEYAADNITDGMDTKFLSSYGPFDIEPDSCLRFVVATFTADAVHQFPLNSLNLPDYAQGYLNNLNFTDVIENSNRALELADSLTNPMMPVITPGVEYQGWDSVVVTWDNWVFDNIDGYQIYLSEIPQDEFPYAGTPPPWLLPDELVPFESLGKASRYKCPALDPQKYYFLNVAHRFAGGVGCGGVPVLINQRGATAGPIPNPEFAYFSEGGTATIRWYPVENYDIGQYRIYRFADRSSSGNPCRPYYTTIWSEADREFFVDSFVVDEKVYYYYAMTPYATTDSGVTSFEDPLPAEGACYIITAVDKDGFETEFSDVIQLFESMQATRDVLLLTELGTNSFVPFDSVRYFYEDVLSGFDYDIYYLWDTLTKYDCFPVHDDCLNWQDLSRFKLVIYDGEGYDEFLSEEFEQEFGFFRKYLLTGNAMAYFGSFFAMNSFDYGTASSHKQNDWFVNRFFGIDSVFFYHYRYYYSNSLPRNLDTCFGFAWAEAADEAFPDIAYAGANDYFAANIRYIWQDSTPFSVSTFAPSDGGEVIYRYRSLYPEDSWIEGLPVGIRMHSSEASTYLFGFHLWYMNRGEAALLIGELLDRTSTGADDSEIPSIPSDFVLRQNYPNPFNPSTVIAFDLPGRARVTLEVYNILGQKVKTLVDGSSFPAGSHSVRWGGDSDSGEIVASGIYFYRLSADGRNRSRKMILLR